jgi:hypothetical protein
MRSRMKKAKRILRGGHQFSDQLGLNPAVFSSDWFLGNELCSRSNRDCRVQGCDGPPVTRSTNEPDGIQRWSRSRQPGQTLLGSPGELSFKVKSTQHCMMQFVSACFKVHFGAVNRAGMEIVKPDDDLLSPLGFQHESRRHHHSSLARHFLPFVPDLFLVEKDNPEM